MRCCSTAFLEVQGKTLPDKGLMVPTREKHSMGRCYSKQLNPSPLPSCAEALQPMPLLLSHAKASSTLSQTWSNSVMRICSYGPDFEAALCVTWTGVKSMARENKSRAFSSVTAWCCCLCQQYFHNSALLKVLDNSKKAGIPWLCGLLLAKRLNSWHAGTITFVNNMKDDNVKARPGAS